MNQSKEESASSNDGKQIQPSLRARLVKPLSLIAAIFIGLIGLSVFFYQDWILDSREKEVVESLGRIISQQIARPMSQGAYIIVETTVANSSVPALVQFVRVLDNSGEEIANIQNPTSPKCMSIHKREFDISSRTHFSQATEGALIGKLELGIQSCDRRALKIQIFSITAAIFLAFMILLLILIPRFIDRSLKPLIEISVQDLDRNKFNRKMIETAPLEIKNLLLHIGAAYDQLAQHELDKKMAQIARQVAHDIRSPLSILTMLEKEFEVLGEKKQNLLRSIVQRINFIAEDLLNKFRSGASEDRAHKPQRENVFLVLQQIIEEKQVEYRDHNVSIRWVHEGSKEVYSNIVGSHFQRVVSNLINNSVDSMPREGGQIEVRLWRDQNLAKVSISDNGKGMSKDVLEKLGTFGFSNGKVGKNLGFGIGIHSAIEMLESFGGQLQFSSSETAGSQGTEALILLPLADEK